MEAEPPPGPQTPDPQTPNPQTVELRVGEIVRSITAPDLVASLQRLDAEDLDALLHLALHRFSQVHEVMCSFCEKTRTEVRKIIAGPDVLICDECVALCVEILEEDDLEGPSTEG